MSQIYILALFVMFGDTRCCKICFFSAAFLRVGVELLRFFLGEGEPTCKLLSLDEEFSFDISILGVGAVDFSTFSFFD